MMTDGCGKMMSTTLVLDENDGDPNTGGGNVTEYSYTQAEIETLVENYLGVSEYQFYQDPNGTYIDHIDCWAKLLDVDKVMIRSVPASPAPLCRPSYRKRVGSGRGSAACMRSTGQRATFAGNSSVSSCEYKGITSSSPANAAVPLLDQNNTPGHCST